MALTARGPKVPLKFGTYTVVGYIVTDEEIDQAMEAYQLEDENGDIVGDVTGFGEKHSKTYNFIPLITTIRPTLGVVVTLGNAEKMILRSLRIARARKQPEMWRMAGEAFPLITI